MAEWTDITDAAVGVGGIPSGTTMTALRDNLIAVIEDDPSAPSIASTALDYPPIATVGALQSGWPASPNATGGPVLLLCELNSNSTGGGNSASLTVEGNTIASASNGGQLHVAIIVANGETFNTSTTGAGTASRKYYRT